MQGEEIKASVKRDQNSASYHLSGPTTPADFRQSNSHKDPPLNPFCNTPMKFNINLHILCYIG